MKVADAADAALPTDRARIDELEAQLLEARELLDAIQSGDVDAVVVGGTAGDARIYTLTDADRPYRILIEQMREGAVTLGDGGVILYANQAMAELVGAGAHDLVGRSLRSLLPTEEKGEQFDRLLAEKGKGELDVTTLDGRRVPVLMAFSSIPQVEAHGQHMMCAVITDLTEEKRRSAELADAHAAIAAEAVRREGEAALRASETQLRVALQAGRFGAWTLDLASGELTTSETCRVNFGRDPALPFTYEDLHRSVHPDDHARMAGAVEKSLATGGDYDIEYRIVTPVGETRWVLIRAKPSHAPDGTPIKMTGVSIDITDRKRDDARKSCLVELADAIRDLRNPDDIADTAAHILGRALAVSRIGYATIDPDTEKLHIQQDSNAPGVESFASVLAPHDYRSVIDSLRRGEFIAVPDVREDERTAATAGALERLGARSFATMPVIEQGRLAAVLYLTHADVREWTADDQLLIREVGERTRTAVERMRVDAALFDSEGRYRTLFESVEQGFCVFDMIFDDAGRPVDYVFTEVNPAFAAQTGLADAVGKRISEIAPGHEQRWYDLYGELALTGVPVRTEDYAQALGRWYEIYAYRVGDPEQRRVAALFNDISERKRSEARIRELNETLEAQVAERTAELRFNRDIIEATTSPICAFDPDYRLIAFNQAHRDEFFRIFGHRVRLGEILPDLFPPDQAPIIRAFMARALAGERYTIIEPFGDPDRAKPYWELNYTPLCDPSGRVIGAFHLANDITVRLRAEAELSAAQEALRQSQKMEAMGSLTGGVAHDFNNLLTPIVGSLDMLQRKGVGNEREQRLIAGAAQSAERARVLVQRLLAFARRQPLQPTAVDLAPLVRGMADLVASTTGPQIKVVVEADDGLPPAKADPNQLEMAILNLSVNARDAMPDGGTLRISVDVDTVERQHRADVAPGQYLRLSVADTGSGMDEATIKRAVEPFFSTKGIGKGTGLGLSMAHGLASQLGGALTIDSTPGIGTTVELWLPRSAASVEIAEPSAEVPTMHVSGTALLVDDEDLVRLSTADMLAELGYSVVEAASAEEALTLVDRGLEPDLVVTDHLMPGISGTELARSLRRSRPASKILIVSGYAESDGIDADLPRLTKPFRSADLAESVAALH